jgi:hypothetical protein
MARKVLQIDDVASRSAGGRQGRDAKRMNGDVRVESQPPNVSVDQFLNRAATHRFRGEAVFAISSRGGRGTKQSPARIVANAGCVEQASIRSAASACSGTSLSFPPLPKISSTR